MWLEPGTKPVTLIVIVNEPVAFSMWPVPDAPLAF
jgi:hypothetical protein